MLIFDTETNGFLDKLTTIHCLVIKDTETGLTVRYRGTDVVEGVLVLHRQTEAGGFICGHNVIKFDIPAMQKVYPSFSPRMDRVRDTIVLTRLIWPDLKRVDHVLVKKGKLPAKYQKKHSLEAWGYRLGVLKDEYAGDPAITDKKERFERRWESWNSTMEDYCVQDVVADEALLNHCESYIAKKGFSQESVELEHHVACIVARQERRGIAFNRPKAEALTQRLLKERVVLEEALREQYGAFYMSAGRETTKRTARYQQAELGIAGYNKKTGEPRYKVMEFTEGVEYTKVKHLVFNPGSRDHIANRLKTIYGWEPVDFTNDGKPKVDDLVMSQLQYPGIEGLKKYLIVEKRVGQIAEGKEAWLKHERSGRIYGGVITNGAVTGRMTHAKPNLGQVPANYSPYGAECRELFEARISYVLCGADAAALELRDLAGYMARFDDGGYVRTVLEGDKSKGTDIHSVNAKALGLDPQQKYFEGETGRDIAKTWFLWKPKGTLRSNPLNKNCVNSGKLQHGQS